MRQTVAWTNLITTTDRTGTGAPPATAGGARSLYFRGPPKPGGNRRAVERWHWGRLSGPTPYRTSCRSLLLQGNISTRREAINFVRRDVVKATNGLTEHIRPERKRVPRRRVLLLPVRRVAG